MDKATRRDFLQFLGRTTALGALAYSTPLLTACQTKPGDSSGQPPIAGITPSMKDDLLLSPGLKYDVLISWGEVINTQGESFGTHNDFTTFVPRPGTDGTEGVLWVNHESVTPSLFHKEYNPQKRTKALAEAERRAVGGSLLHVKKMNGKWALQKNSKWNRRISGETPIPFSEGQKIMGSATAIGTLANCSGGQTPWGTVLTSEENYHHFYGEASFYNGQRNYKPSESFAWQDHFPLPPEHYGWVVEVNPWTGKATKQVALGRAGHEGSTPVLTKAGKAVVYMGEDREGGFLFKFVSEAGDLKKGKLYAADTKKGRWILLDRNKNKKLQATFKTQLDVLTYSRYAAEAAGATPLDRPEDIEVDPKTNNILVSLTNNSKTNNPHGGLLKISEEEDFDSEKFEAKLWLKGGKENGFSCPDNLAFDKRGNLWMTVDISEKVMGTGPYKSFGNNGLFYVPMSGEFAGQAIQVASAPVDAELTGPWFAPDGKTLFLSVQHPGLSARKDPSKPTSHWPGGNKTQAKSSVVTIQGPALEALMKA